MRRRRTAGFESLPATERPNPRSRNLDRLPTRAIVRLISHEDARIAAAVHRTEPSLVQAVEAISGALNRGGRLYYVGAGTSGRLGVLDAVEIPPTFGVSPHTVQAILAGGRRAMFRALEGVEDSRAAGARDLRRKRVGRRDVVVVLSASGTTPYALGALAEARRRGAITVGVTSNPRSELARRAQIRICPETGPEVIAGSTRMKAGTAQKLILNALSTATMVRQGHVHGNLMVNVRMKSRKLRARGVRLLELALDCDAPTAERLLQASHGNLKAAILMGRLGCSRRQAERRLRAAKGHVWRALER
jgi:N-acetylmuramic acid 6-phosphate etherase